MMKHWILTFIRLVLSVNIKLAGSHRESVRVRTDVCSSVLVDLIS